MPPKSLDMLAIRSTIKFSVLVATLFLSLITSSLYIVINVFRKSFARFTLLEVRLILSTSVTLSVLATESLLFMLFVVFFILAIFITISSYSQSFLYKGVLLITNSPVEVIIFFSYSPIPSSRISLSLVMQ